MSRPHSHKRRSPEQIARIVADYEGSGLTQKAFAESRSIPIATLTYWLRKARQLAGPSFVAIETDLPVTDAAFEVISPNGWTIRLLVPDNRIIEALLPLIAQQPCSH